MVMSWRHAALARRASLAWSEMMVETHAGHASAMACDMRMQERRARRSEDLARMLRTFANRLAEL